MSACQDLPISFVLENYLPMNLHIKLLALLLLGTALPQRCTTNLSACLPLAKPNPGPSGKLLAILL